MSFCAGRPAHRNRRRSGWAVALVAVSVLGTGCSEPADADAPGVIRSSPADGSVLEAAPRSVRVWFSPETDVAASRLTIAGPGDRVELAGVHSMGEGDLMGAVSGAATDGDYTITWTAVGPEGQEQTGTVAFSVTAP